MDIDYIDQTSYTLSLFFIFSQGYYVTDMIKK